MYPSISFVSSLRKGILQDIYIYIYLQSPTLMMQIMKDSPVVVHKSKRIPRENIAAVITDSFDGRQRAEYHALPC